MSTFVRPTGISTNWCKNSVTQLSRTRDPAARRGGTFGDDGGGVAEIDAQNADAPVLLGATTQPTRSLPPSRCSPNEPRKVECAALATATSGPFFAVAGLDVGPMPKCWAGCTRTS